MFSARVEQRGGSAVVEIPEGELVHGDVEPGRVYRVAILPRAAAADGAARERREARDRGPRRTPPVEEGDVREVEIEGLGEQGDGIAKVDRGFVLIVPDTAPGDRVEVEVQAVYDNFALASVVEDEPDW